MTQEKKPSRAPILASAFLCPGAGQGMQKRWLPAIIYGLSFIICFVLFLIYVFRLLFFYYQMAFDIEVQYDKIGIAKAGAFITFISTVVIWLISLIDTYAGYLRACRKWAEGKKEWQTTEGR